MFRPQKQPSSGNKNKRKHIEEKQYKNQAKKTISPHSLQTKSKLQMRNCKTIEVQTSPIYYIT